MKKKKWFIINCISLVFLFLIYKSLEHVLKLNNLAFRNIIVYMFISVFAILTLSMLIHIIITLFNIAEKKTIKLRTRVISGIGAIIFSIVIGILLIFGFVTFAFAHQPEHVVEKNGKLMVASVSSFLEVDVNYYDYVNIFVRGSRLKIYENYGNGGYDPFRGDGMSKVRNYIYYDDNGNITESSHIRIQ